MIWKIYHFLFMTRDKNDSLKKNSYNNVIDII